jgi:NAD+ synthase (glutamine-hydrolysing)
MCALLVARMFHYRHRGGAAVQADIRDRFTCAYLATENSGSATRAAARAVAEGIGATFHDGDIQQALDANLAIAAKMTGTPLSWSNPAHDVPLQNVQARLRGGLIWLLANLRGHLLIATSNKSEAAVGYTTMDGDTSGGIAPLADVPKSLIIVWLAWARRFHDLAWLDAVGAVPATAELRPPDRKQTDEDDLMPFPVLDQLMFLFVQRGLDPLPMFQALWPAVALPYYGGDPRRFAAHVRKFVRLLCAAQWKRERFAISFRVTAFDLDPKTGFRFPAVQAPFTKELAELDAYVASL